jgi:hypothetical protein
LIISSYLYGVTVLVHNQNLSIMDTLTFNRIRNGYVIWAIVYVILSLIGGSINCAEWDVNAWLSFSLVATARIHLSQIFPTML